MSQQINDPRFRLGVISKTANPQQVVWSAMHQCVTPLSVLDIHPPDEAKAGELIVKHLLAGGRGHYSPFEHVSICFGVCSTHSVMQQLTRHRIGWGFSVQSFRYTDPMEMFPGVAMSDLSWDDIEEIFYLRSPGRYADREGAKFVYTEEMRQRDLALGLQCLIRYEKNRQAGMPPEQARSLLPFDVRQKWVMSCNARSLMHVLDLRGKKDAQIEIQWLANALLEAFTDWMPETAQWYTENNFMKAKSAP